ncbi:MAG: hypothetical protein JO180_07275 [Gemmatirosa sp.]|nr:hypothetical protein [Gemmatirosa sp.]
MIRPIAAGLLTRTASRRLSRWIPNPLVRTVAIAVAAYGIERLLTKRTRVRA